MSKKEPDMIEQLYYGRLNTTDLRPKRGSDYWKKHQEIDRVLKMASAVMDKESVERLDDLLIDLEEIVGQSFFKLGFQWGTKMVMAVFSDVPEMFGESEGAVDS